MIQDTKSIKRSPLTQSVTRDGKTVQVDIYEDGEGGWLLEVVDEYWNSSVWDTPFTTDREALAEALKTIDEEGIASLIGAPAVEGEGLKGSSRPKLTGMSDAEVILLLKHYKCPTPFHEVRTRFLGNIASPVIGASPMETIKQLWGGELPAFDSMEAVNELLNVLVAGLWNRLTAHQSSRNPFRLLRFDVAQTREGVKHFALVRRQEIDGFVEGLFGLEEHIDLPERAHEELDALAELRATLAGGIDLLDDSSKRAAPDDLKALVHNIQKVTIIAETAMNKVMLSCKRARSQALKQIPATKPATKPTLH